MWLGIDIGTSSAKAVITDSDGLVCATAVRPHHTQSAQPGWFEHDPEAIWWGAVVELCTDLRQQAPDEYGSVVALCVSGIGPCALLTDQNNLPLSNAILYGIDTRASQQIEKAIKVLGVEAIQRKACNPLSSQSVLPKLMWFCDEMPTAFQTARRWHCCSTWLTARLTDQYVCDHYTASVSSPLYDLEEQCWWDEPWALFLRHFEKPRLVWSGEIIGTLTLSAASELALPVHTNVVAGTIDAFAEAFSAGANQPGDTMVMYGSTVFLINHVNRPIQSNQLWAASGRRRSTWCTAGGLAVGGLAASWLSEITGRQLTDLADEAAKLSAGSDGLVMLPYMAGERTPLLDPKARGCLLGLTLDHSPSHLLRAAFEGIAFAVRHNLDVMAQSGAVPQRLVAVGGGTSGNVWPQIVSSVTGLTQDLPSITIGASFGNARSAAAAHNVKTDNWNPIIETIEPIENDRRVYDQRYEMFRRLYPLLADDMHELSSSP